MTKRGRVRPSGVGLRRPQRHNRRLNPARAAPPGRATPAPGDYSDQTVSACQGNERFAVIVLRAIPRVAPSVCNAQEGVAKLAATRVVGCARSSALGRGSITFGLFELARRW